jgi:hypothetical protein
MQMEGLNFAIPAEFVSFSTIGLGTLFVLRALFLVLFDRIKGKKWRVPIALIPFTASVGIAIIGLVALEHIPYELLDSKVVGWNLVSFVWSCFLIGSLAPQRSSCALGLGPGETHRPNGLDHLTGGCHPRLHMVCRGGWPVRPRFSGGFRPRLKMVVRHMICPKCSLWPTNKLSIAKHVRREMTHGLDGLRLWNSGAIYSYWVRFLSRHCLMSFAKLVLG